MAGIGKSIKRIYVVASRFRNLAAKERSSSVQVALRVRMASWRLGFLGESSVFYDWAQFDPTDYVSDLERFAFIPDINGHNAILLDDKVVFRKVIGLVLPVPCHLGVIARGELIQIANEGTVGIGSLFKDQAAFVVKPVRGGGGSFVYVFERNGDRWNINGNPISAGSAEVLLRSLGSYIVEKRVCNGRYSGIINPTTLNTIRILTMVDPRNGQAFIATAIHRFGTSRSAPADNWTQGGLSVALDVDTGRLGCGATCPVDGELEWRSHHPETGARIEGVVVPGWARIRREILKCAEIFAHIPYVGWDVAASEDGFVVIEGNSNTDVNLLQIHGPLLRDSRVRSFYEHHKALAPWR